MINIEEMLVDHDGETVCGDNYEYDVLLVEIRQAIEGKPEQQFGDDHIIEGEEPDWKLVKKNALALCSKTHNLEVMISLTQALAHLEGYSGLADGSALIAGAIEKYWDCLHPQIDPDDNDPIERINLFAIFKDFSFLLAVQKLVLVSARGVGAVNLYDIRKARQADANEEETSNSVRLVDAVFKACDSQDLKDVSNTLQQCIGNFENITSLMRQVENIGDVGAPAFSELLVILNEAKKIVGTYLSDMEPAISQENVDMDTDSNAVNSDAVVSSSSSRNKGINSRADVIAALEEIEAYFIKNEPGSPIPLILRRAKGLVDKDFITLMEDLAPDSVHQVGLVLGTNED